MLARIATVFLVAGCAVTPTVDRGRPNVVVIYTDDQGYGDCSALNSECRFQTPNLDRIAREGLTFTDGHCADSICTPSRYALLTGRYAWRTKLKRGVMGADADCLIEDGRWTLATLLGDRGYTTAMFGKWHLGLQIPGTKGNRDWSLPVTDGPVQKGFQHFYGIPASMNFGVLTWFDDNRATAPASLWTRKKYPPSEIVTKPNDYRMAPPFDTERVKRGDIEVASDFVDEKALAITAAKAVEFIESQDDTPFFVYVAFTSPHLPHCTAPEFRGKSAMGNYGDFMLETDHRVGQILAALDRNGFAENTIVVFSSDNGPENNYKDWIERYDHHSSGGFRGGKRDLYDGGHRVPFFVRWPGVVQADTQSSALVCQVDLLATLAELIGVEMPDDQAEDSVSFAAILHGGQESARRSLVHHSGRGLFALRSGRWKLVCLPSAQKKGFELYDLVADPAESIDLAGDHPDVVQRLMGELSLVVLRGRSREGMPQPNDGPEWWPQLTWIEKPVKR